jgi:hypothetical protein
MDTLTPDAVMPVDVPLISADGDSSFVFQADGNLVLYCHRPAGWVPRWASSTWGQPVTTCILQTDGNRVLYNDGAPVWSSGTWTYLARR